MTIVEVQRLTGKCVSLGTMQYINDVLAAHEPSDYEWTFGHTPNKDAGYIQELIDDKTPEPYDNPIPPFVKTTPNFRFWTFHKGDWVKLTLKPNQHLQTFHVEQTDEGWASNWMRWTHEIDGVWLEYHNDGVDCDGRLESGGELFCYKGHLQAEKAFYPDDCGIFRPKWEKVSQEQRDHQAELAGY